LIIGIGNPSRGDDAMGPILIDWLQQQTTFDCRWNYQLQIEDAEEIQHYHTVLLIDAHINQQQPFVLSEVQAQDDSSFSTHSLTPESLAAINRRYFQQWPKLQLLSLQSEKFELGEDLSLTAKKSMAEAQVFLTQFLSEF
jgi:hydrogenase maturation protease